jgi:GTP-binding protein Era
LVQKESQKGIVLGKKGALIKKIGSESRRDIADVCGSRVALYLFVKIERDWMNHIENYEMVDIEKLPQKK